MVGAGLIGLAHAHAARVRGLSALVLDQDPRPLGGSLRHAGHLFFSALPGRDADTAERARAGWIDLLSRAGAHVDQSGTVIVARRDDELAVMQAGVDERPRRARMLSREQLAHLVPIPTRGLLGAFHGTRDLRIDPRSVTAAIARLLARDPAVRIEWRTQVQTVEAGVVIAGGLRVRARAVVVCPGAEARDIPVALAGEWGVKRQRVHMLRVAAPRGRRYRPAIGASLTLLDHPGFAALPGADELRARIELEYQPLVEHGVAPIISQLPGGDLIVGAARVQEAVPSPFGRERSDQRLLAATEELLGSVCDVRERWQAAGLAAVGGSDEGGEFQVRAPLPGVRVVRALGPLALTLCHVRAAETLGELLSASPGDTSAVADFALSDQRGRLLGLRAHPQAFSVFRARAEPRP